MIKNMLTIVLGLVVLAFVYAFVVPNLTRTDGPVGCTMDAKICPDGSAVGRTGPRCEFAACPESSTGLGTLEVVALLGPICPVMRDPPDPQCADRPYEGDFVVMKDNGIVVRTMRTDVAGTFSLSVPPGTYSVTPISAAALPRCNAVAGIVVLLDQTVTAEISCDTGIR